MKMPPTSPNQSPPTSTPERLPVDYQLDTNSPNLPTLNPTQNVTLGTMIWQQVAKLAVGLN